MGQATIAEIQRFCIHDGPGIRTTVFFKGCHMSCSWCHNPETVNPDPEMLFFEQKCIGCGNCRNVCQRGAHRWSGGRHGVDLRLCISCERKEECARECPAGAMEVCGRKMGERELLREVLLDRDFYGKDGGVTCSGGEPLLQAKFLEGFLSLCRQSGIHVCLDTTLNVDWAVIEPLLPLVDLFLVDVKCMDPVTTLRYTGKDGRFTQENLVRLSDENKPAILRMPLVAGMNDTPAEAKERRRLIEGLKNLVRVDCFAVTGHAASKYRAMGKAVADWNREVDCEEMVERMETWMGLKELGLIDIRKEIR